MPGIEEFGVLTEVVEVNDDGVIELNVKMKIVTECIGCSDDIAPTITTNPAVICAECLKRVQV